MYEHNANQLIMPDEFFLPFKGTLNPDNRWVVRASFRGRDWNRIYEANTKSIV